MLNPAAIEAARYICRRLPGVPKTSFVKYLYLTDREYAARHGHVLLGTKWWREEQGPLSSAVTKLIAGAEFRQDESKSPSGNQRLGHIEVEKMPLKHLGSAELSVLDMVLAEFGALGQVDLLDRVHALPEVEQAEMKSEIVLPMGGRQRSKNYLAELLSEIEREQAAGIHEAEFDEDESESRERAREALTTARALG